MHKNDYFTQMNGPAAVYGEVRTIIKGLFRTFDPSCLKTVFNDVQALYAGRYPGYRECNTAYHDFSHILETFLLTARLTHGACLNGIPFTAKTVFTGLVSALMHDSGYIQSVDDTAGTGAKYTATHVARSIAFADRYLKENCRQSVDRVLCRNCIACTDFNADAAGIDFGSRETKVMAMIVATADILGQVADRRYLEKLSFLYQEFRESQTGDYVDEFDMLEKSLVFFNFVRLKMTEGLGNVKKYLIDHYREWLGIDRDFYSEGMDKNRVYLEKVVDLRRSGYRSMLKRRVPGPADRWQCSRIGG